MIMKAASISGISLNCAVRALVAGAGGGVPAPQKWEAHAATERMLRHNGEVMHRSKQPKKSEHRIRHR